MLSIWVDTTSVISKIDYPTFQRPCKCIPPTVSVFWNLRTLSDVFILTYLQILGRNGGGVSENWQRWWHQSHRARIVPSKIFYRWLRPCMKSHTLKTCQINSVILQLQQMLYQETTVATAQIHLAELDSCEITYL